MVTATAQCDGKLSQPGRHSSGQWFFSGPTLAGIQCGLMPPGPRAHRLTINVGSAAIRSCKTALGQLEAGFVAESHALIFLMDCSEGALLRDPLTSAIEHTPRLSILSPIVRRSGSVIT